jgi:cysteine desulfurase / selenocysteine lyase
MLDIAGIREDFPILNRQIHGRRLVYLDNGATTQKPRQVVDALTNFYTNHNANIHRGIHTLAEEATAQYEQVREHVAALINAPDPAEIVFTRNTTESINLVAMAWGRKFLRAGDEIVVTEMEHHSNIVPWQLVAQATGSRVRAIPFLSDGTLDVDAARRFVRSGRVRLVAATHVSNVLGTVNPVTELAALAHDAGALFLADGAQSVPHMPVDVQALGLDFLAFSAHKMLGPTGVGVLWGRRELLEAMDPYQGGGSMIATVAIEESTWAEIPQKFEAGTPNIADVVAFGAALDYLGDLGMDHVRQHEVALTAYALDQLLALDGVTIHGPLDVEQRGGLIAFTFADLHPHDVSQVLDQYGIAVRAGHHCTQPLHRCLNLEAGATTRASFYVYNDRDDVDALVAALGETGRFFGVPALTPTRAKAG